jgi:hypothetical protein
MWLRAEGKIVLLVFVQPAARLASEQTNDACTVPDTTHLTEATRPGPIKQTQPFEHSGDSLQHPRRVSL